MRQLQAICLLSLLWGGIAGAEEKSPWHSDLKKARETAQKAGKPLFLVFR